MKKFVSILLALILVLSLVACGGDPAVSSGSSSGSGTGNTDSKYGGELRVRWNTLSEGLDPHIFTGWGVYLWAQNVFESPVTRDADGNFAPGVCDFELSEDQTVLKLWVREGKTFHNGEPVEIEDVVASLERAQMQPNVEKYITKYIESVTIENGVATYTFKEFVANTLNYLTGYYTYCSVMPKEICDKYGIDIDKPIMAVEDCIGSGPYKVSKFVENNYVEMVRFDDYVMLEGSTGLATKYAYMDKITLYVNTDNTSAQLAMFAGEYDVCRLNGEEYIEMARAQGFQEWFDPITNVCYINFNTKGDRPVNDVNLRKALAALMCGEEVIPNIRTFYEMEHCPMGKGPYYTDIFNKADYIDYPTLDDAKAFLEQSSYNGEELVWLASGSYDPYAVVMQSRAKEIGINVKIEYMDTGAFKSYYSDNSNPYDMVYLTSSVGSYTPATLAANLKTTFWGNERGQQLWEEMAGYTYGSQESLDAWAELSQLWVDDVPNVILCYGSSCWGLHKDLNVNVQGSTPYFFNAYWNK